MERLNTYHEDEEGTFAEPQSTSRIKKTRVHPTVLIRLSVFLTRDSLVVQKDLIKQDLLMLRTTFQD